ncbi:hypothetical protein L873DRAFT_1789724 [Choiromyces venosus 120613-1]|uniref:Uncharacterized protein n=1 Tax=Choiromyces venosus 120613-1 TaxID=1336337 RepID=A0A3N4JMC3_9PEZI|nr:hypothetical protein L873DRAFT_1789724 [Choiromyces venosus 120613-1]
MNNPGLPFPNMQRYTTTIHTRRRNNCPATMVVGNVVNRSTFDSPLADPSTGALVASVVATERMLTPLLASVLDNCDPQRRYTVADAFFGEALRAYARHDAEVNMSIATSVSSGRVGKKLSDGCMKRGSSGSLKEGESKDGGVIKDGKGKESAEEAAKRKAKEEMDDMDGLGIQVAMLE